MNSHPILIKNHEILPKSANILNMSENDSKLFGEVDFNPNTASDSPATPITDSPNISSAVDEERKQQVAVDAARRRAETVDIDGVPLDEKDVHFKTENIKKRSDADYFVNVEGEAERKRNAARRAREQAELERRATEEAARKTAAEKKATEEAAARKAAAEKKAAAATDKRVLGELRRKAYARKKEIRRVRFRHHRQKLRDRLFKGGNKFITLGVALAAAALILTFVIIPLQQSADRRRAEELAQQQAAEYEQLKETDESLIIEPILDRAEERLDSYDLDGADIYYEEALSKVSTDELRSYIHLRRSQKIFNLMYELKEDRVLSDALKAYELAPDSVDAMRWLATVYERRGDSEAAAELQQKLDQIPPANENVEKGENWGQG